MGTARIQLVEDLKARMKKVAQGRGITQPQMWLPNPVVNFFEDDRVELDRASDQAT